jgi:hypothetical protein
MQNSQKLPSYQQGSPIPAPGPSAPPAYNGPVNWNNQGAMPPAAGGVNPTGPGPAAPQAGTSQMPQLPAGHFTGGAFKRELGNGIRNGLDPAGGQLNPIKATGNIVRNTLDPAGIFGSNDPKKVKGAIDPVTGTYTASNYGKNNAAISAAATEFLRTGNIPKSMKHKDGMFTKVKKQIKDQLAHGGPNGGAWKWGTPSAGAPTVIPGQGPVDWGNAPPPLGQAPGAGVVPPAQGGAQLPGPGSAGPGSLIPPQAGNPGSQPPPAGSPAPGQPQAGWTKPPQLPSPAAYNPQSAVAAALRKPTGGGSKLVGGYGT